MGCPAAVAGTAAGGRLRPLQISISTTEKARNAPNAIFDDMASPSAIKNTGMRTRRGTASSTWMKGLSTTVTQELAASKAPNGSASAAPIANADSISTVVRMIWGKTFPVVTRWARADATWVGELKRSEYPVSPNSHASRAPPYCQISRNAASRMILTHQTTPIAAPRSANQSR